MMKLLGRFIKKKCKSKTYILLYFTRYVKKANNLDDGIDSKDEADMLLRDLGLGKETNFAYPWRPDSPLTPNFCQEAENFQSDSWNSGEMFPGDNCNEFIFTRA